MDLAMKEGEQGVTQEDLITCDVDSAGQNVTMAGQNVTMAGHSVTMAGQNVTLAGQNVTMAGQSVTVAGQNITMATKPPVDVHQKEGAEACDVTRPAYSGWANAPIKLPGTKLSHFSCPVSSHSPIICRHAML